VIAPARNHHDHALIRDIKGRQMPQPDPHQPADDIARALAQSLLQQARHAALAVTDATTATPNISRIAILHTDQTLTLISTLSTHTAALTTDPACAFMVGEPGPKGDPLTHPRLMVQAIATILPHDHPDHQTNRANWLKAHPKAKLYIDFADFHFVRLTPTGALLNAGFGRAYRLTPEDLQT
jgi:heme iron utilization protein